MTVNQIIRDTRKRLRMSTREMGREIGMTHATIGHWENGTSVPEYNDVFYIFTHAEDPALRDMAGAVMRELNPGKAADDLERFCNAVVPA